MNRLTCTYTQTLLNLTCFCKNAILIPGSNPCIVIPGIPAEITMLPTSLCLLFLLTNNASVGYMLLVILVLLVVALKDENRFAGKLKEAVGRRVRCSPPTDRVSLFTAALSVSNESPRSNENSSPLNSVVSTA